MSNERIAVTQATAWYPPYDVGGTEVYVEGLIEELATKGVHCSVITPRNPKAPLSYDHGVAKVETWPVNSTPGLGEMKGDAPHQEFDAFRKLLSRQESTIYHQHSWTRGCGPHHLRAAREMGFRTVLTVHVPGNLCLRGTMMLYGAEVCDGVVDERRCGACWLQSRGLAKMLARGVAALPRVISGQGLRVEGRAASAIAARALAARKAREVVVMAANADRVVAVCEWQFRALVANGVPQDKLFLSRQGVSRSFLETLRSSGVPCDRDANLRLLFLGRWDRTKGIEVVVRALKRLPAKAAVSLKIHAVPAPDDDTEYEMLVRGLAKGDPRISIDPPVARDRLAATLAEHDVLVVPSLWLETGPLVVLEAQSAGLFVLGSRLGGIAELVAEGEAGALVPPGDVAAWSSAIARLAACPPQSSESRPRIRDMAAVAQEMIDLYRSIPITGSVTRCASP